MNNQLNAVLRALEADPIPVSEIARKARVTEREAQTALDRLVEQNLAILEDDGYELTGPLSWFGSFDAAVRHNARKRFVVTVPGHAHSHLYVDDVRVKGRRKSGDPENETVTVLACGRTSLDVAPAFEQDAPTCEVCRSVLRS